jgi:hypothetical protein
MEFSQSRITEYGFKPVMSTVFPHVIRVHYMQIRKLLLRSELRNMLEADGTREAYNAEGSLTPS